MADVAVITPTRNRLPLLRETMDSVRDQSLESWEHLIVDDGSDDGTVDEVTNRASADPRVRYIKRVGARKGANVCRNIGIRASRSPLIVLLDSDDLLRPACLERRVTVMSANRELDFAVSPAGVFKRSVGDLGRLYHSQAPGDDLLRFLSMECPWDISGPVWRRPFLEAIGCFDETLLSMQDLEMHVRAITSRGKYVFLSDADHDIRAHDDSTNTSVRHFSDAAYIQAIEGVQRKLLATVRKGGLLTWSRQRALLGVSFGAAESWARTGRLTLALRSWNSSCDEQYVSLSLRATGLITLGMARVSRAEGDLPFRLINKWKGWVRFRQEPLLQPAVKNVEPSAP